MGCPFQAPPAVWTLPPVAVTPYNRHPPGDGSGRENVSILPESTGCNARYTFVPLYFLVCKRELLAFCDHPVGDANEEWQKGDRAHFANAVAIVARCATMVQNLKSTRPRVIVRRAARGPVNGELISEYLFSEAHLVIPRVAGICPLKEPRVKRYPLPGRDFSSCSVVTSFCSQAPQRQILLRVF